jgi:holliday junction DNA helicase RuvB
MHQRTEFPRNFQEFIGNENIKRILKALARNQLTNRRKIPHIIFYGRPGLGKTTLAEIFCYESAMDLEYVIARQLDLETLTNLIVGITSNDILFIDEVHGLEKQVLEVLFPILQDNIFKYINGDEIVDMQLPYFPIFAATTDLGDLPKPFLDRFRYHLILDNYSPEEMLQIVDLYLKNYHISLTDAGKQLLINVSQKTPRILKNYLNSAIDMNDIPDLTETHILEVMELLGVTKDGLDKTQTKYLDFLRGKPPVGVDGLSAALGLPKKDIMWQVEPFLIETGRVLRTPRGRILNPNLEEV